LNSTRQLLIKIELCRSLFDGLKSEKLASTLLFMADEFDNAFISVCGDPWNDHTAKDINYASRFLAVNKDAIRASVPDDLTALFMVTAMQYIFSGLDGTNKYQYVESLLDACLELDPETGGDREKEQRRLASVFADKLDNLIGNY